MEVVSTRHVTWWGWSPGSHTGRPLAMPAAISWSQQGLALEPRKQMGAQVGRAFWVPCQAPSRSRF